MQTNLLESIALPTGNVHLAMTPIMLVLTMIVLYKLQIEKRIQVGQLIHEIPIRLAKSRILADEIAVA